MKLQSNIVQCITMSLRRRIFVPPQGAKDVAAQFLGFYLHAQAHSRARVCWCGYLCAFVCVYIPRGYSHNTSYLKVSQPVHLRTKNGLSMTGFLSIYSVHSTCRYTDPPIHTLVSCRRAILEARVRNAAAVEPHRLKHIMTHAYTHTHTHARTCTRNDTHTHTHTHTYTYCSTPE